MQPEYEIKIHPLDLSRHGKAPNGKPIYRIVWADRRMTKLAYRGKIIEIARYAHEPETAGKWVMEKLVPLSQYLGMSMEQWESVVRSIVFAPREELDPDGEYELSYVFDGFVDDAEVHKMLDRHEFRARTMNAADHAVEIAEQMDAEEKAEDAKFDALYDEAREESLA